MGGQYHLESIERNKIRIIQFRKLIEENETFSNQLIRLKGRGGGGLLSCTPRLPSTSLINALSPSSFSLTSTLLTCSFSLPLTLSPCSFSLTSTFPLLPSPSLQPLPLLPSLSLPPFYLLPSPDPFNPCRVEGHPQYQSEGRWLGTSRVWGEFI